MEAAQNAAHGGANGGQQVCTTFRSDKQESVATSAGIVTFANSCEAARDIAHMFSGGEGIRTPVTFR